MRGGPLLGGGRGRPAVDLEALCDTAVAVAATALAEDLSLVELNPVVAHHRGVTVVDAVIRLSQSALAPPGRGARAQRAPGTSST